MKFVFVDTFFFVSLLFQRDDWHETVRRLQVGLRGTARLVTTHDVLDEFLAAAAGAGAYYRGRAVESVKRLKADPSLTLIPPSLELFDRGLERYRRRPDKGYSLTDCISMIVMEDRGIREVLTNDHHFEQEGFIILIR
jgi:uncharacterized protein